MKWLISQIKFFFIMLAVNLIGVFIVGLILRVDGIEGFGKLLPLAGFLDFILAYFCLKGNFGNKSDPHLHLVAQSLSINKQKVIDDRVTSTDKSFRMFLTLVITGALLIVVAGVLKIKI